MDPALDDFLAWLADGGVAADDLPVYRRCVEWIVRCAGRSDFDGLDVETAIEAAEREPGAARMVDSIRFAGEAWRRWRAERIDPSGVKVAAPLELPDRSWIERARAQLGARREIARAHLVHLATGRAEPRPVLWIALVDGAAAPQQIIGEIAARLPACALDERLLELRGAEPGPLDDQVRQLGVAIFERVGAAPVRTPPIDQVETAHGVLNKRYSLQLAVDVDGSIPVADCVRAIERRIAGWRSGRAGKAQAVALDVTAPSALHDELRRRVADAGLDVKLTLHE